jgi:hypothetical protein
MMSAAASGDCTNNKSATVNAETTHLYFAFIEHSSEELEPLRGRADLDLAVNKVES